MKTVVQHETYGEIVFEENFWTGKKNLSINGEQLKKVSKNQFQTANGEPITLTGNYLKGSAVVIGIKSIPLTPAIKWYEIVLSVLPFVLILIWGNSVSLCKILPVIGGAIGGAISAVFSVLNVFIIKGIKQIWLKILISVAILAVTFLICMAIGMALISLVDSLI